MSASTALTLDAQLDGASLYDCLHYVLGTFKDDVRIACSFGVEDMVVLHEAVRAASDLRVVPRIFLLDTGRLHQETYNLLDKVRERYAVPIEVFAPDTVAVESLVRQKGANSFYVSVENRRECCGVRKVAPLARALAGARAWITGLRREQAASRASARSVEFDAVGRLLKFNPLVQWTSERVWAFVRENRVPTHTLHSRGYPSIGCAPCTRAVAPDEDPRAGRWWWERPDHADDRECGLHTRVAETS